MITTRYSIITGEGIDSNQNQILCVNIGESMVFGSIAGSDYLYHVPTRDTTVLLRDHIVIRTKYPLQT